MTLTSHPDLPADPVAAVPAGAQASVRELVGLAKCAYTTRSVELDSAAQVLTGLGVVPVPGDLLLARVGEIGQHCKLELQTGRRATLFPGDLVVVCYGSRYAPDQFLGRIPLDLGPCELVAAGGLASRVVEAHEAMGPATELHPVGILCDAQGQRLNLSGAAVEPLTRPGRARAPRIAVLGSSMNAGKTTTAAHLVRGLRAANLRVGAAKVTGTGAGGDRWIFQDSGAAVVHDFTDAGVPATFGLSPRDVLGVMGRVLALLDTHELDVHVVEVADGLYHSETADLVRTPDFRAAFDGVVFAARDALSATAGVSWLESAGLPLLTVSGLLTASPLAVREAVSALPTTSITPTVRLLEPEVASGLLDATVASSTVRAHPPAHDRERLG